MMISSSRPITTQQTNIPSQPLPTQSPYTTTSMQSIHIPMVAPLYAAHKPLLADRFKTKLCETFERQGYCSYDARCMFAHGSDDLRSKEMNLLDGLVTEDAIRNFAVERYGAAAATVDPNRSIVADRFKTRSCENFKRYGECTFAHRCMFAHGEEDLRTTEMNLRDDLTTEEAIKTFQSECITTLRETERRRKRNLKKKTKVRAAKDARRQSDLDIAALVSDDSFVHVVADSISVDASTDEGGAATPHRPTTVIDLELTPTFLVASVTTASTDSALATPAGYRYSHDPYAAVLLGSGGASFWSGSQRFATSTISVASVPLPAVRTVVPEPRGAPFPLARALRALRLRQLVASAAKVSVLETAPLLVLPPSRCALAAKHSVLLP
jgi:hypothetical protein